MANARESALLSVLDWERTGTLVKDALDRRLEGARAGAERRERALAEELALGTVRRRLSLDSAAGAFSTRPVESLDPPVRQALRQGLYQLYFLDRVPRHALVDESVKLANRLSGRSSGGFVNAVLRAACRAFGGKHSGRPDAGKMRASVYAPGGRYADVGALIAADDDGTAVLASFYSCPPWLVERLPDPVEDVLAWAAEPPHMGARLNRLRPPREPEAVFEGAEVVRPGEIAGSFVISPNTPVAEMPGLESGAFTIQDESAQLVSRMLGPERGERILDLCAAPGTKTTHLAELADDDAEIVACDADPSRLQSVAAGAERLGLRSVRAVLCDGTRPPKEFAGTFDAVLVDAPCSNTGAMNRRAEARWRLSPETLRGLAERQMLLLRGGGRCLRPGGRLVYSTCSLLREENEEVVRRLLAQGRFELADERLTLPVRGARDGGYAAVLELRT